MKSTPTSVIVGGIAVATLILSLLLICCLRRNCYIRRRILSKKNNKNPYFDDDDNNSNTDHVKLSVSDGLIANLGRSRQQNHPYSDTTYDKETSSNLRNHGRNNDSSSFMDVELADDTVSRRFS